MSLPYPQYDTAYDVYVAADGSSLNTALTPTQATTQYVNVFGSTDAARAYAESRNLSLVNEGQALLTSAGVESVNNILIALAAKGYSGPTDTASLAMAYNQLVVTPTTTAAATTAATSSTSGSIGGLGPISEKTLVVGGGALLLLLLLMKRR